MNKKGQAGFILGVGMTVLLIVITLSIIYSFMSENSLNILDVLNESVTLSSGTGYLDNDDLTAVSELRNSTMDVVTEECNITLETGYLQCNTSAFTDNLCYADYSYKPDGYVDSPLARILLSFLPIILATISLIFVAGYIQFKK